jgi:hypothetical protein
MKWLENFLRKMDDLLPARDFPVAALKRLDPERIEVENVRSVLGVSTGRAKDVCESAVRRGVFARRVSIHCPDGAVAWTGAPEAIPPATVRCLKETEFGPEPERTPSASLMRKDYFVLAHR